LRSDDRAVRFVEVVVNGPKSWSLAAELHPDISHAYDAAQDRAATQIIGWLAQHATTRVGRRGAQVQVPVGEIEAVTVRHYTSRAGDPHRHLHLQINARVFAEGHWRGLHTVGVRDSLDAINGIGHAAVMTDPAFREALAAHGFTLDRDTGEVVQLAGFVGPFSARAAQIGRNIDRYEADWRTANPGQEPGPALVRAWDARAWADARPDKVVPRDGGEMARRWVAELHALGYRDRADVARLDALPVGRVDREQVVTQVLSRLGARSSGWNAADIRGEVEQLIARRNVVIDGPIRGELAEDLTARTLAHCVPLTDRPGVPEHIRALTSRDVLDVEADLTERLAARANAPASACEARGVDTVVGLDDRQREVVTALGSDAALLVIEGAAGAGKTTTLAAARTVIERNGGRLRVLTPTLRAARVAAEQVGVDASSAAWLVYQHGFRWDEHGRWTRLAPGALDPDTSIVFRGPNETATLRRGEVLLVDEAGMLDQDTARALLTVADEHHARVALVGDRKPTNRLAGYRRARRLSWAPQPHPTSATSIPAASRSSIPGSSDST
jgi:exodeoxyribonuclease V alpha subunit